MKKHLSIGACLVAALLALSFQAKQLFGQPGQLAAAVSASDTAILPFPIVLPSEPSIIGNYSVQFYSEPNHNLTATQCIVFSKGPSIVGESNSGKWFSTTFSGWGGEWLQEGEHIQWYGFTRGGLAYSADGNLFTNDSRGTNTSNMGAGTFNTFLPSGYTNAGAFVLNRVPSCQGTILLESLDPNADPSGQK
jgi:hypothetical protein